MTGQRTLLDVKEIARRLNDDAPALCQKLLPAGRRCGPEWRVGSVANEPGQSLGVRLTGPKRGVWGDLATGEAGDALDLVAAVLYRGDRRSALIWARDWLKIDTGGPVRPPRPVEAYREIREAEQDEAKQQRAAKRMWLGAHPIERGCPVWCYLAGRGIDLGRLPKLPGALRYHPELWCQEAGARLPAMVAAINTPPASPPSADGQGPLKAQLATGDGTGAVHRTWLEQQGGAWKKAKLATPKKVFGRCAGGFIPLARGLSGRPISAAPKGDIVAIGEGIETVLSVAVERPEWRFLAGISLTNMGAIRLPAVFQYIVLLLDADPYLPARFEQKLRMVQAFERQGHDVRRLTPPPGFKDWNDWLVAARGPVTAEAAA